MYSIYHCERFISFNILKITSFYSCSESQEEIFKIHTSPYPSMTRVVMYIIYTNAFTLCLTILYVGFLIAYILRIWTYCAFQIPFTQLIPKRAIFSKAAVQCCAWKEGASRYRFYEPFRNSVEDQVLEQFEGLPSNDLDR